MSTPVAAMLRGMNLTVRNVAQVRTDPRPEFVAVLVKPNGHRVEALGRDEDDAVRNAIKVVVRR